MDDTLVATLDRILEKRHLFDQVVVETMGIADPAALVRTFWVDEGLDSEIYLDGIVTVVDCKNFERMLSVGLRPLVNTELGMGEKAVQAEDSDTAELMMKQVICGDVVVLNKAGEAEPSVLDSVDRTIRSLNPTAELLHASRCIVPIEKIVSIRAYGEGNLHFGRLADGPPSLNEVKHVRSLSSLVLRLGYGEDTWVMSLKKLNDALADVIWEKSCGNIYRVKGLFKAEVNTYLIDGADVASRGHSGRWYALQGVGDVFELDEVHGNVAKTLSDRTALKATPGLLLFIGAGIDSKKLENIILSCKT